HPFAHLLFLFRTLPPPSSPLFPYTPLFRSLASAGCWPHSAVYPRAISSVTTWPRWSKKPAGRNPCSRMPANRWPNITAHAFPPRSEEHTSELQSRENLVCRLLLEKKKTLTE